MQSGNNIESAGSRGSGLCRRVLGELLHPGSGCVFFAVATAVGLLSGAGAWLLKLLIGWISRLLTAHFRHGEIHWALLALPLAGIVLASLYERYVIRRDIAHGSERIRRSLLAGRYNMPGKMLFSPIVASVLTLGFGGSAGSEGPIATTGAAIGSNLARRLGLPEQSVGLMMAIGAGAGIAGIFKAPIGGALFTLEVLGMAMGTRAVLALLCSCLAAGLTASALSGFSIAVAFDRAEAFEPSELAAACVLGLFCALYSMLYNRTRAMTRRRLERIGARHGQLQHLAAGAALALAVFAFPSLFGEGYGAIGRVINGDTSAMASESPLLRLLGSGPWAILAVTAAVATVKGIAMSATTSGGGVAGDFAPTLFAGCAAGLFFALGTNMIAGTQLSAANFALYGMAATMAGALRAPLMAIFLVTEMTASFGYILPMSLASAIAFAMVRAAEALRGAGKGA